MPKKVTSVSLDEDVVKAARELNLNISQVCNDSIKEMIKILSGIGDPRKIKYRVLQSQLASLLAQQERLNAEQATLADEIVRIEKLLELREGALEEEDRSEEIAAIMKELNAEIIRVQFNVDEAWNNCKDLLLNLQALKYPMDFEKFASHVSLLEKMTGGV